MTAPPRPGAGPCVWPALLRALRGPRGHRTGCHSAALGSGCSGPSVVGGGPLGPEHLPRLLWEGQGGPGPHRGVVAGSGGPLTPHRPSIEGDAGGGALQARWLRFLAHFCGSHGRALPEARGPSGTCGEAAGKFLSCVLGRWPLPPGPLPQWGWFGVFLSSECSVLWLNSGGSAHVAVRLCVRMLGGWCLCVPCSCGTPAPVVRTCPAALPGVPTPPKGRWVRVVLWEPHHRPLPSAGLGPS